MIGTAGNELWATGEWSETGQGKTGELIPTKGYWLCIYVREGDDWKIRVMAGNATPDSVLLINKSFAQQPAATPSPTANPSTQSTRNEFFVDTSPKGHRDGFLSTTDTSVEDFSHTNILVTRFQRPPLYLPHPGLGLGFPEIAPSALSTYIWVSWQLMESLGSRIGLSELLSKFLLPEQRCS